MNKKIKFIIPCIIVLITISISIIISISKEKVMTTNKAVSGIAIYVNNGTSYVSQSSVPTGSYYLNTKLSHCVAKGEINSYNSATGAVSYSLGGSDRCYLYFDQGTVSMQTGNASEEIINLAKNDSTNLAYDDFGNVRYIGANPNNYVCFDDGNGGCINYDKDDAANKPGGLFRIIGVFNDDTHGVIAKQLVKLVTADNYYIESEDSYLVVFDTNEKNDWSTSSLNSELNGSYLTNYLTSAQVSLISDATWHLGGPDSTSAELKTTSFYEYERGTAVYDGHSSGWYGKIGLIYPSDWGYATSGGSTYTRSVCLNNYELYDWDNYSDCYTNNWLNYTDSRTGAQSSYGGDTWTITPHATSYTAFHMYQNYIVDYYVYEWSCAMPSFYLKSDVYIKGGSGTSTDPYRVGSPTAAEKITYLASKDTTNLATDDNGNVRYIGANPNNYACLSSDGSTCINYDKDDASNATGGLFRIIGVFNEDTHGVANTQLVKLITADRLGETGISWDLKRGSTSVPTASSIYLYGSNDWSDSQLMYMLNGSVGNNKGYQSLAPVYGTTTPIRTLTYSDNNVYYKSSNYFYTNYSGNSYLSAGDGTTTSSRTLNIPTGVANGSNYSSSSTLTVNSLVPSQTRMIKEVTWHLGGYSDNNMGVPAFYTYERGSTVVSSGYTKRPYTWIGKIGLMYPSDYGYATSGGTTYNRNACLTGYLYPNNWSTFTDCSTNDWLLYPGARTGTQGTAKYQWTISPYSSRTYTVFVVDSTGNITYGDMNYTLGVRPAFYLESSVYVAGGSGTSTDPYIFTLS